jgi:hypothetical protein
MAGALTGLADSYYGAMINPAGSALTLNRVDLDLSKFTISDQITMAPGQVLSGNTIGIAVPLKEMGVSLGYTTPYLVTNATGNTARLSDYRMSFSKSFFENHLSFGLGLVFDQISVNSISLGQVGYTLGTLYRFPNRFFLGATYNTPMLFGPDSQNEVFSLPRSATLGLGWIPNRLFRAGFSLEWVGAENNTYLYHQPTQATGQYSTVQVHLGTTYEFLSTHSLRMILYSGTYLEALRTSISYRPHLTTGLEVRPWFIHAAFIIDVADQYQNTLFNIGLDVKDALNRLNVLPREVSAPPAGFLPPPFETNEDWLPQKLQDHPETAFHGVQPDADVYQKLIKKEIDQLLHPKPKKKENPLPHLKSTHGPG